MIDLTWIIAMPALGPGLSYLQVPTLYRGQINLPKAQLRSCRTSAQSLLVSLLCVPALSSRTVFGDGDVLHCPIW